MKKVKIVERSDEDVIITIDTLLKNIKYIYGIKIREVEEYNVIEKSRGIILSDLEKNEFKILTCEKFDDKHECLKLDKLSKKKILENSEDIMRFNNVSEALGWLYKKD